MYIKAQFLPCHQELISTWGVKEMTEQEKTRPFRLDNLTQSSKMTWRKETTNSFESTHVLKPSCACPCAHGRAHRHRINT